jgi:hypothetical protein
VRDGCSQRRNRADADIRAGSRGRARGRKDDDWQPNVAEDEPDQSPRESGDEAPEADCHEEERVQTLEYP